MQCDWRRSDAAKTFLLASSVWWGRAQGCGCGRSCRKGPPRSFYRSALIILYICFPSLLCLSLSICLKYTNLRKYPRTPGFEAHQPENQPRPDEPTRPAAGHFTPADFTHPLCAVCISLSPAASSLRQQCQFSAAAFTARHLLPACLPNHCWLCEAGRYRPVSSSSLLFLFSPITLKTTPQPCHGHPFVMQALQVRKRRRSSDADGHGRDVQPLDKVRYC